MTKRYCEMCDEWVEGKECPKCGAEARREAAVKEATRVYGAGRGQAQEELRGRYMTSESSRSSPLTTATDASASVLDDSPSVLGGGCGLSPMPTRVAAEAVWRRLYVDRMVARGVDRESAQACCDAGDADLSTDPEDAADDELQYWTDDGDR